MTTEPVSPDTVQLALAVNPGQTSYQLAARLGLRITYGSRRMTYDYPVRACLVLLEKAGHVRHEDVPGGRGARGFHRVWYRTEEVANA